MYMSDGQRQQANIPETPNLKIESCEYYMYTPTHHLTLSYTCLFSKVAECLEHFIEAMIPLLKVGHLVHAQMIGC